MKTGEIIMGYHTEGVIKEITVKGNAAITFTLAPTDEFAFGKDESDGRKIILLKKANNKNAKKPLDAKVVAQDTEFKFCIKNLGKKKKDASKSDDETEVLSNLLYSIKKDRSRVRLSASNVSRTVCPITSITIL